MYVIFNEPIKALCISSDWVETDLCGNKRAIPGPKTLETVFLLGFKESSGNFIVDVYSEQIKGVYDWRRFLPLSDIDGVAVLQIP